jgi:plastocyanin domain-containing protein
MNPKIQTFFISGVLVTLLAIAGMIMLFTQITTDSETATAENVTTENGKQVIEIDAKGGYSPLKTQAKAGEPTLLKVKTDGTYDCSTALRIPKLKYAKNLSPSGEEVIELPPQKAGSKITGGCSMGMYNFEVAFN